MRRTLEYKKISEFSAIAKVKIDGELFWRHRRDGIDSDYPLETFKDIEEFYNIVKREKLRIIG